MPAHKTHGKSETAEYCAWRSMKKRCLLGSDAHYPNYGGRGIQVCDRWLASFENFLEDMGAKPDPSYSLERLDTNGNYDPSNCIWATKATQAQNRRTASAIYGNEIGIDYQRGDDRWRARIMRNGKRLTLGSFSSREEAIAARRNYERLV
jgi:hypothetical protein